MEFSLSFEHALLDCVDLMRSATDPWWIIGSVSMAVHGVDPGPMGDIDFLVSERDASAFSQKWKIENSAGSGSDLFRSSILLKRAICDVDVEIMAGLKVNNQGSWCPVSPRTRQLILRNGVALFVPELTEVIDIFRLFGRPKDTVRADLMLAAL